MVKWWSAIEGHVGQLRGLILPRVNHIGDMDKKMGIIDSEIDILILHCHAVDTKAMPWFLRGRVDASGEYIQGINGFLQCAQQFYSGLRSIKSTAI